MTRRVRVLSLVHNLFFGGDETRLLAFAKAHDRAHFEHVIASIHLPDKRYVQRHGSIREEYRTAGAEVVDLGEHHHSAHTNSSRPDHVWGALKSLSRVSGKVRQLIREREIDIIDARLSAPIAVGAFVGRLTRTPSVGTTYSFEGEPSIVRTLTTQASFAMSDVIVTDSDIWRERIEKAIRLPGARVVNIPNGIYTPRAHRSEHEVKELLGIPTNEELSIVGQVSRLVPYKGHRVLIDAAKTVLASVPNAFFLIVGHAADAGYRAQLESQVRQLGIADRVRIAAYSGHIGDVWNIIDVHAHASHLDSLPNSIIEGMSMARPAVVTDVGGIPDLVTHEETGLVVPTRNAEALSDGVLRLLQDTDYARHLGLAAQQRYRESYTPQIMVRRLEALFREVIERRRGKN